MNIQQTLVIVKPDGLVKGLVGLILRGIQKHNLSVINSFKTKLSRDWVKKLYAGEEKEVYFEEIVQWVSSAPVLLLKVQGKDAVNTVKQNIVGRYPNGIRGQHSENWIKNVAHAPDSIKSAERELKLAEPIFKKREKVDAQRFNNKLVFALTGMSECGKSTVGKYLDFCGVPRLKIVRLFERIRDKWSPEEELYQFTAKEENRDPYALWDAFILELLFEMKTKKAAMVSIESLYGGGLGPYLKQKMTEHFCIVYVDIPLEIRLQRQIQREGLSTIEEAKTALLPRDEVKTASGIPQLKLIADEVIDNSGTLEDLYRLVDEMVAKHSSIVTKIANPIAKS